MRAWVCPLLMLLVPFAAAAADERGVDELFEEARRVGFKGRRAQAREICREILARSPGYQDVRVFLGRLHAWDSDYDAARRHLLRVIDERPTHLDGRLALIDVELWSKRFPQALVLANDGLELHPAEDELLLRKARALDKVGRHQEALAIARRLSRRNADARRLAGQLVKYPGGYKASAEVSYEDFDDSRAPWRDLALELQRRFRFGSLIGRVNLADRFDRSAVQYEIDAYPKIARGTNLYLNAGYSSSDIFPDRRLGAEIYRSLPGHFEAALGFRHLDFGSSDVTLYTGYIGRYEGDYFIWLRPFVSDKRAGTSYSGQLFVRRYFGDSETYLTIIGGSGSSPDEDIVTQELDRLDSWKLSASYQQRMWRMWVLKGGIGYRSEEFENFRRRDSWRLSVGFERFF